MVHQLPAKLTSLGTIAIALLLTLVTGCLASEEYVFTAPPEAAELEAEEIPARETEYPLYECNSEENAEAGTEAETALDSHDCSCVDCEDLFTESASDEDSSSQSDASEP